MRSCFPSSIWPLGRGVLFRRTEARLPEESFKAVEKTSLLSSSVRRGERCSIKSHTAQRLGALSLSDTWSIQNAAPEAVSAKGAAFGHFARRLAMRFSSPGSVILFAAAHSSGRHAHSCQRSDVGAFSI